MKKVFQLKSIAVAIVAVFMSTMALAQGAKVIPSPRDSVSGKIGAATVSINYGSPSVKGRTVFGGLQPWDKMWRAGANEATTITTDKEITVEGKKIPAGKYTFFITPTEKGDWTITLNAQVGQWGIKRTGEANEDPTKDVVTAKVKIKTAPQTERLKYVITSTGFSLIWENVEIPVSVK